MDYDDNIVCIFIPKLPSKQLEVRSYALIKTQYGFAVQNIVTENAVFKFSSFLYSVKTGKIFAGVLARASNAKKLFIG